MSCKYPGSPCTATRLQRRRIGMRCATTFCHCEQRQVIARGFCIAARSADAAVAPWRSGIAAGKRLSELLATVWIGRYRWIVENCTRLLRVNSFAEGHQIIPFKLVPFLKRPVHCHTNSLQGHERFG